MPEPSAFDVEMVIEKLKRHKSLSTDQISAELIKGGGRTILSERPTNLLILFGIGKYCLKIGRSRSLYLFIRRVFE